MYNNTPPSCFDALGPWEIHTQSLRKRTIGWWTAYNPHGLAGVRIDAMILTHNYHGTGEWELEFWFPMSPPMVNGSRLLRITDDDPTVVALHYITTMLTNEWGQWEIT